MDFLFLRNLLFFICVFYVFSKFYKIIKKLFLVYPEFKINFNFNVNFIHNLKRYFMNSIPVISTSNNKFFNTLIKLITIYCNYIINLTIIDFRYLLIK